MTVVLAFASPYMTIIMSDDRVNYGRYQNYGYSDGNTKLINLPNMGWASGAGLSDFLDEFQALITTSEINNTDDLLDIYKNSVNKFKKINPELSIFVEESAVIFSWLGFASEKLLFRVGTFSEKHFGEDLRIVENGRISITYPGDYLEDIKKVAGIEQKYNLWIKDGTFNEILLTMLNIFKEISLDSIYCSTHCDVGIQILQQDGVYKIKISDEIDDLIESLKEDELEKKFSIIDVIR